MSTFKDLGLNPMILQALDDLNFETPTQIQNKVIPHLINSENDIIALAQTGTGKTAAFALPVIEQIDAKQNFVQSIILCPTRELALQVSADIEKFTKYIPNIKVLTVYGGESIDKQIRALKKRPQIIVGTPGRVHDMQKRKFLDLKSIKWLVLDEADEMLNMGFKEELDRILEETPKEKQVLLFSATMDNSIRKIAKNYMKKADEITVGEKNQGAKNVEHFYYLIHERDRYAALRRIADANPDIHGIVFCRTRRETQRVADQLIQDHYSAEVIHGDISQSQRTHVMNKFKDKKIKLLVATDVAARGIDVDNLSHVINYNLPESLESYVHRSGRTGRAGNSGISLILINMREQHRIKALERKIGKKFEKGKIPSGADICEKQLFKLMDKMSEIKVNEEQIEKYMPLIMKKFEEMDRDELVKKFVSVEFNRFLNKYKNAPNINPDQREQRDRQNKTKMLFARFKVNIGKNLGLSVKEFLEFINSQHELKGIELGDINIEKSFTTFEADQEYKNKIEKVFKEAELESDEEIEIVCEETGIVSTKVPKKRSSRNRGGSRGGYRGNRNRSHGGSRGNRSGNKGGYRGNRKKY